VGSSPSLPTRDSKEFGEREKGKKKTSPREFLLLSPRHHSKLLDRFRRFGSSASSKPSKSEGALPNTTTSTAPKNGKKSTGTFLSSEGSWGSEESSGVPDFSETPENTDTPENQEPFPLVSSIYSEILETSQGGRFDRWLHHTLCDIEVNEADLEVEKKDFLREIYTLFGPDVAFNMMRKFHPCGKNGKSAHGKHEEGTSGGLKRSPSITQLELDRYENERANVLPNGKFLTGRLLRVSSEERLVRKGACGDQVLSPREMEARQARIAGKLHRRPASPSPIRVACTTTSSSGDEFWENSKPPPAPSRRGTIRGDPHPSGPLTQDEASAAKLYRLLICHERQDEFSKRMHQTRERSHQRSNSGFADKDRIIRHGAEPVGRARSSSVDRYSSVSMSSSESSPSLSHIKRTKEKKPCLSPRDRGELDAKKNSEQRLCRQVVLSISGGMYVDGEGHTVYDGISGIRIEDDDAIVLGAIQCTFTGDRMVLKDIKECQVLGNGCDVEGADNFIRGHMCVVSGPGNVVHV
jgi:hypothetical protein